MQDAKAIAKKSPSGHHHTTLSGYMFATKAHIDNRKKVAKQQYLLHMSPQYGELRPTSGWDPFVSLGHLANFNGFRALASLLQPRRSTEANQTLHNVWPLAGLVDYIYIRLLLRNGILPGAKFTLRPPKSCALLLAVLLHGSRAVGANQTAVLSTGLHLYSASRPSGWALPHILVYM